MMVEVRPVDRNFKHSWPRIWSKVGRSRVNGRKVVSQASCLLPVGRLCERRQAGSLSCCEKSRSGQAMAEFLVGLVGIMLLVVGLQQISIISKSSFDAHVNARTRLAEQLIDPMSDYTGEYIFVDTVDKGPDEKLYTGDDRIVEGDDSFFTEGDGFLDLVNYYDLSGTLLDYDMEDPYHRMEDSSFLELSESFSMYYGMDIQEVEVVPFLRKVVGRDYIELQREAWIPSWGKLMEVVP